MNSKDKIPLQSSTGENLSPLPGSLRKDRNNLKVPDGYFDSLNPMIVEGIKKQENKAIINLSLIRKPLIWAPMLAASVVALLLVLTIPVKQASTIPLTDEWAEINMAYDASYAEEVLLAESFSMENEIENTDGTSISASLSGSNEATDEEITEYLKDQELDIEIITDK
jgi:hypothetical protein